MRSPSRVLATVVGVVALGAGAALLDVNRSSESKPTGVEGVHGLERLFAPLVESPAPPESQGQACPSWVVALYPSVKDC